MTNDFSTPQRQNLRGIFVIFFMTFLKRIQHNIYVFLPLLNDHIRNHYLGYVILGFILLLLFHLFYSYKSYLNFQFHVEKHRFFLRHGVFKITDTDIPFDRIQNININQNLIQQILNVVGFEIETAGQGAAEIKIKALSREDAHALKQILLKDASPSTISAHQLPEENPAQPDIRLLFQLSFANLLKVGLSANYLKGLGLVMAFIMTLFQYIQDIYTHLFDLDVDESYFYNITSTFGVITILVILIVTASFFVTVILSVVRYFELKIRQIGHDFEVEYGLIKRVNQVIKKSKTQVLEIENNPIKDLFKIKNVFISQASSQEITDNQKIGLVGVSEKEIKILFESLFDLSYPQNFVHFYSNIRYLFKLMIRYFIITLAICLGLFLWDGIILSTIFFILLITIFTFISYLTVKKSHIGLNEELIEIHSGVIHTNRKYIATYKIQAVTIRRNWYQQRNQHADLIIYTASGSACIHYLKKEEALRIANYLIFKLESSQLSWI